MYAYKLEGYDENWIDMGNRNIVSFTNLDGGTYKLLVKATNSSGKWGEKILSIDLIVSPPPWKTWWAYSLYVLAILLLIFVFIYFRTRLQQKKLIGRKNLLLRLRSKLWKKLHH